jgi:hypothetical protein
MRHYHDRHEEAKNISSFSGCLFIGCVFLSPNLPEFLDQFPGSGLIFPGLFLEVGGVNYPFSGALRLPSIEYTPQKFSDFRQIPDSRGRPVVFPVIDGGFFDSDYIRHLFLLKL